MRRRGRPGPLLVAGLFLVGAVAGAAGLSLVFHNRDSEPAAAADPDLSIEVLNGCGSEGAADRVAMLLRSAGYRVDYVGNADHFHYREDVVIARTLGRERILPLGAVLGEVALIEQRRAGHLYDVTVVVGRTRTLGPDISD